MSEPAFSFSDHARRTITRYPYSFYYEYDTNECFDEAILWIEERVGVGYDLEEVSDRDLHAVAGMGLLPYTYLQGVAITIADHDLAFEFRMRWC